MTWQARSKTKKLYKERALGKHITDFASDESLGGYEKQIGKVAVCGPFPGPHKWYASVVLDENGVVQKVS